MTVMRRVSKIDAEAGDPAIPDHSDAPMVWVDVDSVVPWKNNPRVNDEAAKWLAVRIRAHGFVDPIIIWRGNGVMYAGDTRVKAAKLLGMARVPARFINFPDERSAIEFGLADNRANEQASWSQEKLADLFSGELEAVDPEEIEASAGFTPEEREGLLSGWVGNDPTKDWQGMLEHEHEDQTSFQKIVVHFKSQEDVDRFAALVGQSLTEQTRSIWYPKIERLVVEDKRYGE